MNQTSPLQARFGPYRLDEAQALLERDGAALELAPRAFQVLCALVRQPGQLVTKDALLDAVWGHRHINEAALKNIVSQLRQALGDDAKDARFIQTAARRGYRFIAPVVDAAVVAATPPVALVPALVPDRLLVGRDAAFARLQSALAASRRGERRFVFVLGDAGIGKSTVVERFAASAEGRQGFGQCIEHYGRAEPYMPVLEALNALCRGEGGASVVQTMRRVAPTWLLQFPWLIEDREQEGLQQQAGGANQDRMLREFGEFIDRMAAERPLLLVLEDLHWSDHATVHLLRYLARRRNPAALMVLGTFRPTELILEDHPLADLRQELRMLRLCEEIELEALSEAELGAYLEARIGESVPEEFARALHAHTSGLPLFVVNVIDELKASESIAPGKGFPAADQLAVPRSIAGLIERQVSRLSDEQQRVLGAASVCGIEFLHVLLNQVVELPEPELLRLLDDTAARVPWVRSTGASALADGRIAARYAFGHAIYRRVLYERLSAGQKLQLHRSCAAALQALHRSAPDEIAGELALHLERGGAPAAAAAQLAVVAARAMARGAAHEALHACRRALQIGKGGIEPPLEQDLRVLEAVAISRLHVLSEPEVAAAFERARAVGAVDCPSWPRALHGCWWVHFARAEFEPARTLATEMLSLAEHNGDHALRITALNAMGLVSMMTGDLVGAEQYLQGALEACAGAEGLPSTRFVQDPESEATAALALVSWVIGQPATARSLAQRATALAAGGGHPLTEVAALYCAAIVHSLAGEHDTVLALTERLYEVIQEETVPESRSNFAWLHGRALVSLGRVDEGLAEMRAAARTGEQLGMRTGLASFHFHHAEACREAGRHADARASVEAGLALAEGAERMLLSPLLLQQAVMEAEAGDGAAAAAALARSIAVARSQGAAFHELTALATAQRMGSGSADPERLRELLSFYENDASPVIAAARSALAGAAGR
ncbi:ATP-binding protein [Variovorax sp. AFSI2.2]|uniref:ATP-binding protein n=1 Tax=Variovorax sp. AFSI2.2 TaxID=3384160 RepID=UPI003EBAE924